MEVDLASVEVVFAQKLASGEPTTRQRALRVLHDWIRDQSAKKQFETDDLMRLCKGLHYVMWMQDKMVLQEEMADRIAGLIDIFTSEEEKILYVRCFLNSLSKEWPHIDRWRMDKFLMEVRRMIRSTFGHLAALKWKKEIRDKYWNVFEETVMSADKSFNEALKFHFASILLDELDHAGGLTKKQMTTCIQPYANLLGNKTVSEYLFQSVIDEVFTAILMQKSDAITAAEEGDEPMEQGGIEFNYKDLSKMLFDAGKKTEINAKRRAKIYNLVKKFDKCAADQDPLHFEAPVPKEVMKREDYEGATERFIQMGEQMKAERVKSKKAKVLLRAKEREQEKAEREANDDDDDETPKKTKKKAAHVPKVKRAKSMKVGGAGGKRKLIASKAGRKKKN